MGKHDARIAEIVEEAKAHVSKGLRPLDAVKLAGLSPRSWRRWRQDAKAGIEPFAAAVAAIKSSELSRKAWLLEQVTRHAAESWQCAAWNLERRWPEEFGKREYQNIRTNTEPQKHSPAEIEKVARAYVASVDKRTNGKAA